MADKHIPPITKESAAIDFDGIAKVVTDLHIAHRNLSIYPPTHEQVKQSVQKAYQGLSTFLEAHQTITFAILKDGLLVEETPLTANHQMCKEFAQILKQYQIATLTFEQDVEEMELIRFLLLIGADRQEINDQGGIEAAAQDLNLSNILITAVDYSKLHLTEEREIQRSDDQDGEASVWQQFVTHILSAEADGVEKKVQNLHDALSPDELASLLNQDQIDVRLALKQYDTTLDEVAHHQTDELQAHEGLQHFQEMIKELKPELRKQFLDATLQSCTAADTGSDQFVEGLGADLIVQMIRQANAAGQEISPSLLSLLKKMGHLGNPLEPLADGPDTVEGELTSEHVASLLAHEEYDHYVDEEYGILLDDIAGSDQDTAIGLDSRSLSQQLTETLDDTNINCHVGRAMAGLMTHSRDSMSYRSWARQLSYVLSDLLDTQSYGCLAETLKFIVKERGNQDQEKAKIADIVWNHFNSPEFVAQAVGRVIKSDGETAIQGDEFLQQLGEPVVVEILDQLRSGETDTDRKKLIKSLDKFGPLAAQEAVERLSDSRLTYLRMMIQIIRRLGDPKSAEQLRSLLTHENVEIRMEALGTLLRFNNKWGLIRIRELITETWSDITEKSIALCGTYKVKDVVPILISFVQRRGDAQRQEASLRALGQIGDARAIPVLDKLARRRWSVSKKHRLNLKRVVFETLEGYETEAAKDLLHFGLRQKDEFIQRICENMLRKSSIKANQPE